MNQSFPYRQKHNLWEKKFNSKFWKFFYNLVSPILSLFEYETFVTRHQLERNLYSHKANQFFYLQKKFSKIMTEIESIDICLKNQFVPWRHNGLLGINVDITTLWVIYDWSITILQLIYIFCRIILWLIYNFIMTNI